MKPFLTIPEEVESTLLCEICGVIASKNPWPKGWCETGRSAIRILIDDSAIASWCDKHGPEPYKLLHNPTEEQISIIRERLLYGAMAPTQSLMTSLSKFSKKLERIKVEPIFKMKIPIRTHVVKEVEVQLPIYRRHDLDHSTIYTRIDNDGKYFIETSITASAGCIEVDTKSYQQFNDSSSEDYILGKDAYASSEQEFDSAWQEAITFIIKAIATPWKK